MGKKGTGITCSYLNDPLKRKRQPIVYEKYEYYVCPDAKLFKGFCARDGAACLSSFCMLQPAKERVVTAR